MDDLISSPDDFYGGVSDNDGRTEGKIRWRVGVVDTIYEDHEEAVVHQTPSGDGMSNTGYNGMNLAFPKDGACIFLENSRYATAYAASQEILRRSVWSWGEATGFPTTVTVYIKGHSFKLHKFPLVSRSGFLKRQLMEGNEIYLPQTFPGGAETFEMIAAYCYGSSILMNPFNIAALRCAAEFLEMTEEYCRGNLCKQSEFYFNQVILKNQEDAIEVLRNCKNLHPLAEEMLIVNSCVEAISMRVLMGLFETKYQLNEEIFVESCEDWWINDLLTLPFDYFGQIIACIRRRGMPEKFIGRALLFYVDRWIVDILRAGDYSSNFHDKSLDCEEIQVFSRSERRGVIESIVRLLPPDNDVLPVSFLFAILRCALAWTASSECRAQLEERIAAQLEQATITDFLLPLKTDEEQLFASRSEIDSMQRIVSHYIASSQQSNISTGKDDLEDSFFNDGIKGSLCSTNPCVSVVAKIWDEYLAEIAFDPMLSPFTFLNLIQTVPSSARLWHDRLYKAIHIYLKAHPQMSDQERQNICRTLNCQKLSKQICVHAVQNDLLPLRMIVQAMFMHQLHARSAFNSFQGNDINKADEHLPAAAPKIPSKGIDNTNFRENENGSLSAGYTLRRGEAFRQENHLNADFHETSSRLRNLEEEIARMRINLQASLRKNNVYDMDDIGLSQRHEQKKYIVVDETKERPPQPEKFPKVSSRSVSSMCLKQPTLVRKGCGSTGVTGTFVRSMQKLSLKTSKQTVEDSSNNQVCELTQSSAKLNDRYGARCLHKHNQSESQVVSVSVDSEILRSKHSKSHYVAATKSARRRRRSNHSASS